MAQDTRLTEVSVEGLHDQFDIELTLKPGLNILYGKNGRGKTTILHLIANAVELDLRRFSYLQFRRIRFTNNSGENVEILRASNDAIPSIAINGSLTSYSEANPTLSDAEASSLRDILGARPTYLPAFRSVLERTRTDPTEYYRATQERRDSDFDRIVAAEVSALAELLPSKASTPPFERRQLQEEATATALKTTQCRQWFGPFVPTIRYPSVADVDDALSEEWRRAQVEVTSREQRMYEEMFVKVFRTISGLEHPERVDNNENLLSSIADLLNDPDSQLAMESRQVYDSLLAAAKSIDASSFALRGVDNSLLEIYRQVLQNRNTERRAAFQRSKDFEASVNKFLDRKTLTIGIQSPKRMRTRSAVAVSTEGGHSYGLSALSSGERQILTMLYSANRAKFLSGIFLIDEPELSLHIDWQRIVLNELRKQSPERQIIACTHSPEVGADHLFDTQDFEPRESGKVQDTLFSDEGDL